MNNLKNKKILILQQRGWARNVGQHIAKSFQANNCRLAALAFKRATYEFVLKQKDVKYDLIVSNDEIMARPKEYLGKDDYTLEEICENLGAKSIWPFVMSLRHHVRSYKDKFYYGYKQNVSDEEIIDYIKASYKCVLNIFNSFNPDVIIAPNFVSLPHLMLNLYAQKRDVKMLTVIDSKVKGYYIFSYSYNDDIGPFFTRIDELNSASVETKNREKAQKYIEDFRKSFKKPDDFEDILENAKKSRTFFRKIKHEFSPLKHIFQWYFNKNRSRKNYLESLGVTADYRPPKIILRDHYSFNKYLKYANNFSYYSLAKIKKYIYFPLQYQPESTIDVSAPYFSNQIETARQLAMSLPGDYTLVVKDHPAMTGLRAPSYLEKIYRTPNVKLIDYRISSEDVLKGASIIISPSSTTIAEASFLKIPGIQLGNLGTTLKLPSVFKHSDLSTISEKIVELLKIDLNTPEYERQLENYVAAVFDTGFNIKYIDIWEKASTDRLNELCEIFQKEVERILSK